MLNIADNQTVEKLEEKILHSLMSGKYKAGQKLSSVRKLAKDLQCTTYKVHCAIRNLTYKGIFYTRKGDGIYLKKIPTQRQSVKSKNGPDSLKEKDQAVFAMDAYSANSTVKLKRVTVSLASHKGYSEFEKMWELLLAPFRKNFPDIELLLDFSTESSSYADIVVSDLRSVRQNADRYISLKNICNELDKGGTGFKETGILEIAKVSGDIRGIPIMRYPTALWLRTNLGNELKIIPEDFKRVEDLFRIGGIAEKQTNYSIKGTNFPSFLYFAAMGGICFSEKKGNLFFNREKLGQVMKALKPYISNHHFSERIQSAAENIIEGNYAVFCHFSILSVFEKSFKHRLSPILPPLGSEGFGCECAPFVSLNKKTENLTAATKLIEFLFSKEFHENMAETYPGILSVRKDTLEKQKEKSAFAYDFDIRSYYTQIYDKVWNSSYKLNNEFNKYVSGFQDLKMTLANMAE